MKIFSLSTMKKTNPIKANLKIGKNERKLSLHKGL